MIKIKDVRFAESVKVGANTEEVWINTTTAKHKKYELFLSEIGMVWIHDKDKDIWTGTSQSNIRSATAESNPFEIKTRKLNQRANSESRD